MKFSEAFRRMQYGEKLKMPEWKGYWYWDDNKQTIMIHEYNGNELDIRETKNVAYTFRFICSEDWVVFDDKPKQEKTFEERFVEYYSKLFKSVTEQN